MVFKSVQPEILFISFLNCDSFVRPKKSQCRICHHFQWTTPPSSRWQMWGEFPKVAAATIWREINRTTKCCTNTTKKRSTKYRFPYVVFFHVSGLKKKYICMLIAIKIEPSFIFALWDSQRCIYEEHERDDRNVCFLRFSAFYDLHQPGFRQDVLVERTFGKTLRSLPLLQGKKETLILKLFLDAFLYRFIYG